MFTIVMKNPNIVDIMDTHVYSFDIKLETLTFTTCQYEFARSLNTCGLVSKKNLNSQILRNNHELDSIVVN